MMGAVQPFISGAISKTVNMPEDVTVEDVEQLHIDAWRLGLKAVAIYRDNCKVAQPLSTTKKEADGGQGGDLAPAGSEAEARDRAVADPHRRARGGAGARAAAGDGVGGGGRGARAPAPQAQLEDVLVPGGRLRGLRDGRRVRGRPSGRGVHQGLQAGLDPGRDHGRLLHLDQPRAAARRAAGHLRAQVRQHEVRAGRASPTTPSCASPPASSTTSSAGWRSTTCPWRSARTSASSPPRSARSRRCPGWRRWRPRRSASSRTG